MTMLEMREQNLNVAKALGYPVNESLPVLDDPEEIRSLSDTTDRMLCLNAVVASSYGFSKNKAMKWLEREGAVNHLAESEKEYLQSESDEMANAQKQWQVEALWALAWCVGCHDQLDFADSCSDGFIQMLPDIAKDESTERFRETLNLRNVPEILQKADLAYCLHWAVRDAETRGHKAPGKVPGNVVAERRRALDWVIAEDQWDDLTLDT